MVSKFFFYSSRKLVTTVNLTIYVFCVLCFADPEKYKDVSLETDEEDQGICDAPMIITISIYQLVVGCSACLESFKLLCNKQHSSY